MTRNPFRALKRLLTERRALARREQQLLNQMISALPPAGGNRDGLARATSRRKALTCRRCDRRFALPMHLGRHMAMSHKRRRAA